METQTPLWDGDTGDMDATTRDALAALVTLPFVTDFDHVRQSSDSLLKVIEQDERTFGLIRRDLDNLGRELVIDTKLRVAFARQRDEVDAARIRRTAWRRTVREGASRGLLDADILYMAIKLRQHLDETLARNEAIARMTTDELYAAFSGSPSATKLDGDAEAVRRAFDRCVDALKQTSSGLGLITKEKALDLYTILPTTLLLVSDDFCRTLADAEQDDAADNDVPQTGAQDQNPEQDEEG